MRKRIQRLLPCGVFIKAHIPFDKYIHVEVSSASGSYYDTGNGSFTLIISPDNLPALAELIDHFSAPPQPPKKSFWTQLRTELRSWWSL